MEVTRLLVASYFDIVRKNLQVGARVVVCCCAAVFLLCCVALRWACGPPLARAAFFSAGKQRRALSACHHTRTRAPAPPSPPPRQDGVPKALMHFMVNAVQRGLQQHLIRKLYREVCAVGVWVCGCGVCVGQP